MDLTSCDREKIQFIASIQGHGALVVVGNADFKIRHSSANFGGFFRSKDSGEKLRGKRVSDLLGPELTTLIQTKLKGSLFRGEGRHAFRWKKERDLNVYLFAMGEGQVGIEFEDLSELAPSEEAAPASEESLLRFVREMKKARTLPELGSSACRAIRELTGMERVMLYRFSPVTWEGEVLAEDRVASSHSFLGHRFPATDIPKPARDLYLRNQVRFIHDSHAETSEVHPRLAVNSMDPIDLSDSRLRAVSPIHIVYLKNMGVRTSFSVAITVGGNLWGLIACHHREPIYIPHATRSLSETVANAVGLAAPMIENQENQRRALALQSGLYGIFGKLKRIDGPLEELFKNPDEILALFQSSGMAFVSKDGVELVGTTLPRSEIVSLADRIRQETEGSKGVPFRSERLGEIDPKFEAFSETISGALAVRVPEVSDGVFVLFRPERIRTIEWGGDPRKTLEARGFQGPINPRESFASWTETVRGRSLSWTEEEIAGIGHLRDLVFDSLVRTDRLLSELRNSKAWTKTST